METVTADRWLYATLTGDVTLMGLVTGVYTWPVPPTALLPYVLYQEQTATDVQPLGGSRIMVNGLWLVRVVADAYNWTSMEPIANRIDVLLQGKGGSVAQGNVWACVRERPFRMIEETSQRGQYRHLGGVYRLFVK